MTRPETIRFELRHYKSDEKSFESDLVAQLPGLIITQSPVRELGSLAQSGDEIALRFDFIDDWYSVLAFLDGSKQPTGHYLISTQTPLRNEGGIWKGNDLILRLEVFPRGEYVISEEENFYTAIDEGWMRVHAAAKAREALRKLCFMLDEGCLPQEVMDAVGG